MAMINKNVKKENEFEKLNEQKEVKANVSVVQVKQPDEKYEDKNTKSSLLNANTTAPATVSKDLTLKEQPNKKETPAIVKKNTVPPKVIEVKQPNNKISSEAKPSILKPNDSKKNVQSSTLVSVKPTILESRSVSEKNVCFIRFFISQFKLNKITEKLFSAIILLFIRR
jgi:hypothetical protein